MSLYENVVTELAELSAWNFKRQQRIEELEAQLAAEVKRREEAEAWWKLREKTANDLLEMAEGLHKNTVKAEAELAEERAVIQRYQKADDAAVQLLQKAKMTLEVPAAEYVPAMSDAWELIEKALEKIR